MARFCTAVAMVPCLLVCSSVALSAADANPQSAPKDSDEPKEQDISQTKHAWTVRPSFHISGLSWPSIVPHMRRFMTTADLPTGSLGAWSTLGDQISWRGVYEDFDAMHSHHQALMGHVQDLIRDTDASLGSFEIQGPGLEFLSAATTKQLDPSLALKADYFEQGSFTRSSWPSSATSATKCEISERITIKDWGMAVPLINDLVGKTRVDPGCTSSSWAKKGDELRLEETYTDGKAVAKHFEIASPIFEKLFDGPASLESAEVHGPKAELENAKNIPEALKGSILPSYFAIADSASTDEELLKHLEEVGDFSDAGEL